jgi:hypothetical protein
MNWNNQVVRANLSHEYFTGEKMRVRITIGIIAIFIFVFSLINQFGLPSNIKQYCFWAEYTLFPIVASILLSEDISTLFRVKRKTAGAMIGLIVAVFSFKLSLVFVVVNWFIHPVNRTVIAPNYPISPPLALLVLILFLIMGSRILIAVACFFGYLAIVIKDFVIHRNSVFEEVKYFFKRPSENELNYVKSGLIFRIQRSIFIIVILVCIVFAVFKLAEIFQPH